MKRRTGLTRRQSDVLRMLSYMQVTGSGYDGSVLRSLEAKGLVLRSHNSAPGYIYYTWTLTDQGKLTVRDMKGALNGGR